VEATEHDSKGQLLAVTKCDFERCFQHWEKQWEVCLCTKERALNVINFS